MRDAVAASERCTNWLIGPGRINRSQKRSNRGLGLGCKLESG